MAQEIERKFRVRNDGWRAASDGGRRIRQGYLVAEKARSVRVRVAGDEAKLTIKGESRGAVRPEYEYAIPVADAEAMLDGLCLEPRIEKTRHLVEHVGWTWEVDEFHGENRGLVVAEVELDSDQDDPPRPDWLGEEVTDDPRYYNANLVGSPYSRWGGR